MESVHRVEMLTKVVYIRYNFEGEWYPLQGLKGNFFLTLDEAQDFLRTHIKGCYWEISTYEQAIMGNGMRDNV